MTFDCCAFCSIPLIVSRYSKDQQTFYCTPVCAELDLIDMEEPRASTTKPIQLTP